MTLLMVAAATVTGCGGDEQNTALEAECRGTLNAELGKINTGKARLTPQQRQITAAGVAGLCADAVANGVMGADQATVDRELPVLLLRHPNVLIPTCEASGRGSLAGIPAKYLEGLTEERWTRDMCTAAVTSGRFTDEGIDAKSMTDLFIGRPGLLEPFLYAGLMHDYDRRPIPWIERIDFQIAARRIANRSAAEGLFKVTSVAPFRAKMDHRRLRAIAVEELSATGA